MILQLPDAKTHMSSQIAERDEKIRNLEARIREKDDNLEDLHAKYERTIESQVRNKIHSYPMIIILPSSETHTRA